MELVLDLHIHSRFSRAVSQKMNPSNMFIWGKKKGINILGTGDFTHPIWFRELKNELVEENEGIYRIKNNNQRSNTDPRFILATELSCIYSESGKVYRIHNLVLAPSFEVVEKINKTLLSHGFNLSSDGRPILGLSSRNLAELLFSIDENIFIIPCHVWTPWFSLYGSRSGYDSIDECFKDYSKKIYAVETGLSSDPSMNWRIKELSNRSIVSFSDSHSLEKMGREATVLRKKDLKLKTTFQEVVSAFKQDPKGNLEIAHTIEFYPEEGKYHFTGHRNCGVSYSPEETKEKGEICPVCHKPLTVGVMHRIDELASEKADNYKLEKDEFGLVWIKDPNKIRPPYISLVPLLEILKEALSSGISSINVLSTYDRLISNFGSELKVLTKTQISEIQKIAGERVAGGIKKVRERDISISPGFDGEFGHVSIWSAVSKKGEDDNNKNGDEDVQLGLGI